MTQPDPPNGYIADRLEELAALLRLRKADRFRVRAYERAARVVRAVPLPLTDLPEDEILRLEGIGAAVAGVIAEVIATGSVAMLDDLLRDEPAGTAALLRLPLIGVRDARALAGTYGVHDVDALRQSVEAGTVTDDRLRSRAAESLRRHDGVAHDGRPAPMARRDTAALRESLLAVAGVSDAIVAGDVRRGIDTVVEVAFVLVVDRPVTDVAEGVASARAVVRLLDQPAGRMTVLTAAGHAVVLWLTPPEAAGAALLHATGPQGHVEALGHRAEDADASLRSDGLWKGDGRLAGATEHEIYTALGMEVVPPELRAGQRDVNAAARAVLPSLVDTSDLRGDLHVHTDWSGDGKAGLLEMVAAAAGRGYAYVALTDHAENLRINGMSRDEVRARRAAIAQAQERHPEIRILDSAELNIGLDGTIDYDLDFLLEFDIGVASIHSHMDRLTPQQTDRLLAAIDHPAVNVIGHPTGRILGHRPAYGIEIAAVATAAAETGTALEINGSPRRLDLSGEMAAVAVSAGALLSVSSDAHSVAELDYIDNAVPNARRGWATPTDVLNCRDVDGLLAFVAAKRQRGG